ncbi:MAG: hypothetical protein AAGG75_22285 [Bacteroidota bacterium]
MQAKIKRTSTDFIFDSRLEKPALTLLQGCIGSSIRSIHLERAQLAVLPTLKISCMGRCCFRFKSKDPKVVALNFIFQSHFQEIKGPIVDQGALAIQKIVTEKRPLREALLNPPQDIDSSFATLIQYPSQDPIVRIRLYGNQERLNLKDIEPNINQEDLIKWGFSDYPNMEIDSIEFVSFEHENGSQTILSLDNGGFWIQLLREGSIDELMANSYIKPNGYDKSIILQHEIV